MIPEAAVVTLSEVVTLAVEHVRSKGVQGQVVGSPQERHRDDMEVTSVLERIYLRGSLSAGRRPCSLQAGTYIGGGSVSGQ